MDKISEIFNSIKDRLSNPLIFSFLVSWLVYNWKIPVALIWFDDKHISANGCKSIFEFIENELSNGYFWWPLFIAIGYTFLFPVFKNLISASQTWMTKWGENLNLYISKNGKVGIEKYLSLRNEYSEKIEELEKIISKESEIREYNKSLFSDKADLDANNYQLQLKIQTLENEIDLISDSRFLHGQWNFIFNDDLGNEIIENIKIIDNKWYRITNGIIENSPIFTIDNFFYNKKYNKLIFVKYDRTNNIIRTNTLSLNDENHFNGKENNLFVRYERLPNIN